MINRLLGCLQDMELTLTDEEIADSVWLAVQMQLRTPRVIPETPSPQPDPSPSPSPVPEGNEDFPERSVPISPPSGPDNHQPEPDIPNEDPAADAVLPEDVSEDPDEVDGEEMPFRAPATTALQNSLGIARALRALMRRVPSQTQWIVDEEATVSLIAERDVWVPVLKPAMERWLDLELVVEASRSSFIWDDAVEELQHLMQCQGAFRNVRVWRLQAAADHPEAPQIRPLNRWCQETIQSHSPKELIHASGRGLIVCLSDCTSALWIGGQLHKWLQQWSMNGPVALMQLLPERLWQSSQLGLGESVQIQALAPGAPNPKLVLESLTPWERELIDWQNALLLPVIGLDARSIEQWAELVRGSSDVNVSGFLFDVPFVQSQADQVHETTSETLAVSAEQLVDRFLLTASPIAQRLAGLMAAAPVSLPVVHLIQKKLVPGSSPVHVAEVFLSGLIQRVSAADAAVASYEFVKDARKLLNRAMRWVDTREVLDAVSNYVMDQLGRDKKGFAAFLLEHQDWEIEEQAQVLPFAQIALKVLRNLGGDYEIFADTIVRKRKASLISNFGFPDLPPLSEFSCDVPMVVLEDDIVSTEPEDPILGSLVPETVSVRVPTVVVVAPEEVEPPEAMELPTVVKTLNVVTFSAQEAEQSQSFSFRLVKLEREGNPITRLLQPGRGWRINPRSFENYGYTEQLSRDVVLELTQIPSGSFRMGSPADEPGRVDSEGPQHEVTFESGFWMGRYPVTQAQWRVVAEFQSVERGLEPYPSYFQGDDRPVERVSWHDAMEFCSRLSQYTGRTYRLPSEAEWEYACRGRTQTPFHFGEMITTNVANYNGNKSYAGGPRGTRRGETTVVTEFNLGNGFGLSDMHGNVWEWCLDHWNNNYDGAPDDGSAWLEPPQKSNYGRVVRGGSWYNFPRNGRSASRLNHFPDVLSSDIGFRVILAPRSAPPSRQG